MDALLVSFISKTIRSCHDPRANKTYILVLRQHSLCSSVCSPKPHQNLVQTPVQNFLVSLGYLILVIADYFCSLQNHPSIAFPARVVAQLSLLHLQLRFASIIALRHTCCLLAMEQVNIDAFLRPLTPFPAWARFSTQFWYSATFWAIVFWVLW